MLYTTIISHLELLAALSAVPQPPVPDCYYS
jgi:hypothetical protein